MATTAFALQVSVPNHTDNDNENDSNEDLARIQAETIEAIHKSISCSPADFIGRVPVVRSVRFRISSQPRQVPAGDDKPYDNAETGEPNEDIPRIPFAAIFCPSSLLESAYHQVSEQSNEATPLVSWFDSSTALSNGVLSLIHPFLAQNFTIRAILATKSAAITTATTTTSASEQPPVIHAPGDIVLLDLSHTPRAAIEDLLDATNGQNIQSGPDAILKILLLQTVQFVTTAAMNEIEGVDATNSSRLVPKSDDSSSVTTRGDWPTCAVCLHRIDPPRLGLPPPLSHQRCSQFCPPPNMVVRGKEDAGSCPRQRLLRPWPFPSHCQACHVIQNYWDVNITRRGGPVAHGADIVGQLVCSLCGMKETLWVCLTCAFVGCGRYSNKHASDHYSETRHPYCLELSTLRIWSYMDGEFAHRLDFLECPSSPPLLQPWLVRMGMGHATDDSFRWNGYVATSNQQTGSSTTTENGDKQLFDLDEYERLAAFDFSSTEKKTPMKATMIGEEYEALLQSALEEQAQHYEGEITSLRAKLTALKIDQDSVTQSEALEIATIREQIAMLRTDIDREGRELLDSQAQEAGHRATSQRLLREQRVAQDLLTQIREDAATEHEQGRMQIEDLELQIDDLKANNRMMEQFLQNDDLKNSQIFGTEHAQNPKQKKSKKVRNFFRR